jgi:hypothetical protein
MILLEEAKAVLAVGGEDENGNLLNSCEFYSLADNNWKTLNSLNNPGKGISLCKFTGMREQDRRIFVYAFNKTHIERMNLQSINTNPKWDDIKI